MEIDRLQSGFTSLLLERVNPEKNKTPFLQVRTQTRNDDLQATFRPWYPAIPAAETPQRLAA